MRCFFCNWQAQPLNEVLGLLNSMTKIHLAKHPSVHSVARGYRVQCSKYLFSQNVQLQDSSVVRVASSMIVRYT